MAAGTFFNQFIEDVHHGVHNMSSDQLVVALSSVAPVATNTVLANLTEISYTNMSTRNLTISSEGQTSGDYDIVIADLVLTMTGSASPAFRYVSIYNDTPTSPADPLVAFYDRGSSSAIPDGESLTLDFPALAWYSDDAA